LLLISVLISGCGSSSDNSLNESSEVWFFPDTNDYFEIKKSGVVSLYECSLHDGYVVDDALSGVVNNGELELFFEGGDSTIFYIESNGEVNSLVIDEFNISFDIVNEIPNSCDDDAIEITYFSPEDAIEGVETEFVVNFDYRLSSSESAIIEIGFTKDEVGTFTLTNSELEVLEPGTSSGSLTVSVFPSLIQNSQPYRLHIIMYEPVEPGESFSPTAEDSEIINVSVAN